MRTNRFVLWLGLLVVATLSVGALSFLLLRREGDKMRDNAEQSRLMANEATSRAKLYHEMARQSRAMAEYAEQAAEDSLAIRARTVADTRFKACAQKRASGRKIGLFNVVVALER